MRMLWESGIGAEEVRWRKRRRDSGDAGRILTMFRK